jgi:hypothetical protein
MGARYGNLSQREQEARKVAIPARRAARPAPTVRKPTPAASPKAQTVIKPESVASPQDLARVRHDLGFDDIPLGQPGDDERSLRDVIGLWATQSFHLNHPDNKVGKVLKVFSRQKLKSWKEDLKWALEADLDDAPAKPKQETTQSPGSTPTRRSIHTSGTPIRPHAAHQAIQPAQPLAPAADPTKSVEININFGQLPKLPTLPKPPAPKEVMAKARAFKWTRTRIIIASVSVVVIAGGIVAWRTIPGLSNPNGVTVSAVSSDQAPAYTTVLPSGKSIDALGGWHRVSPPEQDPVFAYVDTINNVRISVSQQPLPEKFRPNVDSNIADLAKGYAATDKISVGNVTMYVGTSSQGPQSAILARGDTLVLIKSVSKIDDKAWASYAQSLN